jgi:hypothetical protein
MGRFWLVVGMTGAMVCAPLAQEAEPWRETVTGQIEAFRAGDGAAALQLAGASFQANFSDAEAFLAAIVGLGYGPIVQSRSHSFGAVTRISEVQVLQVVRLVGPDQSLYEAVYQLADEPGLGWRVQGVVLRKQEGMGV